MSVLLSLTVAVPLACLAFLSLLGFVGIVTLGAVIHLVGAVKAVGGTGGRIGARSPARCRSLPSGSPNPSVEFAGPGMLATAARTQRNSDDRTSHQYE